ncbi:hypothetical protein PLICRDRAFT_247249 [Plicaturopsis crispa FD-325 SS-3]|nr:hypothetical protein PLICRDRAFT_247249 [Plicaturopsis crispa FD-325 SS-3]
MLQYTIRYACFALLVLASTFPISQCLVIGIENRACPERPTQGFIEFAGGLPTRDPDTDCPVGSSVPSIFYA